MAAGLLETAATVPLPLIVSGWYSDKGAWIEPFEHRHLVPLLLKQLGIVHPNILEAPEAVILKEVEMSRDAVIQVIDKYYPRDREARHILLTHSRLVADKA